MKIIRLSVFTVLTMLAANLSRANEVQMSAEDAYSKTARILVDIGALPTFRDKELLIIKTDPMPVKLSPEQADCGKMFGIAYLRDKRTKTAATYQVSIKPIDAQKSDVTLKVKIDGYMDVTEGAAFFIDKTRDTTKVLNCSSSGYLESQFFEKLNTP